MIQYGIEANGFRPEEIDMFWPIKSFKDAYKEKKGEDILRSSIVTLTREDDIKNLSLLVVRMFIENTEKLHSKDGQKYILGLKFYNFGQLATLDIISVDKDVHREIACDHLQKMGWPVIGQEFNTVIDRFQETTLSPFLFIGGRVRINSDGTLEFFGESGDYGNDFMIKNINDVSEFLDKTCRQQNGNLEGEKFVQEILSIMLNHKGKDFYEEFIKEILQNSHLKTQQMGAIVTMKALDRSIEEKIDFIQAMIEEVSGGVSQFMFLQSVAKNINRK